VLKRTFVLIAVFAGLVSCGDSSTGPTPPPDPPPPPPSQAQKNIVLVPSTVLATPSGDPTLPWVASITVRINETAGLGANINFINFDTEGIPTINFGASDIVATSGSNSVPANGSLDAMIPVIFSVTGLPALVPFTVTVNCTDANGNRSDLTADGFISVLGGGGTNSTRILEMRRGPGF